MTLNQKVVLAFMPKDVFTLGGVPNPIYSQFCDLHTMTC
jgi:hypothetical protein